MGIQCFPWSTACRVWFLCQTRYHGELIDSDTTFSKEIWMKNSCHEIKFMGGFQSQLTFFINGRVWAVSVHVWCPQPFLCFLLTADRVGVGDGDAGIARISNWNGTLILLCLVTADIFWLRIKRYHIMTSVWRSFVFRQTGSTGVHLDLLIREGKFLHPN